MARSAIQLYTLRNVDDPLESILREIEDSGYEGVEFAQRVHDADLDAVTAALDETGLETVSAHVGLDAIEDDLDETVEFYRALDCDRFVVPWLDAEHFESEAAVRETAARLTEAAESLADYGVDLCYHNHDHEYELVDGTPAFELLAEYSTDPLGFEVDLGWVTVGGGDPVSFLERWGDRVPLVHVSDAEADRTPTDVGDGVLDVERCAKAVRESDIQWAIYEHDEPDDPMASMRGGVAALEQF
ncbi:sugar phosphate isomerase/epimerase family protein [Haloprofundus salinisoli]|uniref:sugar phosphate isomerase/epimerase family protein n=1 Tax=Haloprofundus salinisoli TaxID=2876193 RepID=UPI001CCF8A9B|nr:sugar phosphate isomerase/epimerase [Haloprofundus salinisoli]